MNDSVIDRAIPPTPDQVLARARELRRQLSGSFREEAVKSLYAEAERVAQRAVSQDGNTRALDFDQRVDHLVTSPWLGLPIMLALLSVVFWLTIAGANVPSAMLAQALFWIEDQAAGLFDAAGVPWWVTGFLWHGVYRGLAWVVSVMLPPMAIFFPLFTMFEDLGYLPRVAFNLDFLFRRAGAHGKQALTMAMGFGCNAAGVIATRIIDSPRERLVAILTNNFVPCNGRFPTLIMLGTIFVGASFAPGLRVHRRRGRRGRRRRARHRLHPADVVAALAHDPAGRSIDIHARTAALSPAEHRPHLLHLAHRPDAVRPVARDVDRGARRCRHLAARQHPLGRPDAGGDLGRLARSARPRPSAWTASSCSPTSSPSRPTRSWCRHWSWPTWAPG